MKEPMAKTTGSAPAPADERTSTTGVRRSEQKSGTMTQAMGRELSHARKSGEADLGARSVVEAAGGRGRRFRFVTMGLPGRLEGRTFAYAMRDLAKHLARLDPAERERIERLRRRSSAPPAIGKRPPGALALSFAQRRMWFLEQLAKGSAVNNIAARFRVEGALDEAALERAFAAVIARHAVLRTAVVVERGEPRPVLWEHAPLSLARAVSASEAEASALLDRDAARPIELAKAPLLRVTLVRFGEERALLGVVVHHLAADALSMKVLADELGAALRGEALPPLSLDYADVASHELARAEQPEQQASLEAWKLRLAGAPSALDLGFDRPRGRMIATATARLSMELGAEVTGRLAAFARAQRATTFMVASAALAALLGRAAHTDDVVIGTAVAGRPSRETEALIGPFLNSVALRVNVGGSPSLADVCARAREVSLEAFQHQEVPFERVVAAVDTERSQRHAPLFQTLLIVNSGEAPSLVIPGARVTPLPAETGESAMDLTFVIYERPEALGLTLRYATALFDEASARTFLHGFARLLEATAMDPAREVASIDLLDEPARALLDDEAAPSAGRARALALLARAEREARVLGFTRVPAPALDRPVFQAFVEQAAKTPEAVALVGEGGPLRYREVERRSRLLASWLVRKGVEPGAVVGLLVDRKVDDVVAMLAVLRAGAAYAPMAIDTPPARLARQIEETGLCWLLGRAEDLARVEASSARALAVEEAFEAAPSDATIDVVDGERPAYVIFTSGSTGTPKGVVIAHRSLAWYCAVIARDLRLGERPRSFAVVSTLAADLALTCLFPALATGGSVHLFARELVLDGARLAAQIAQVPIDVLKITPSHLAALMERGGSGVLPREVVVLGGEALPWGLVDRIERAGGVRWINEYGPTETTVGCVALGRGEGGRVAREAASVPSGRPMPGVRALVLDAQGELAPIGAAGQLFVGGPGVARGYLGRDEETQARFVRDRFAEEEGEARMYATGDRARWLPGGLLEHLGRIDEQVKIRGHRIEPGDVAAALRRLPWVADAAVIAAGEGEELRLVGYVVTRGEPPLTAALRDALREELPEVMIPAAFVLLDALPLGPNGKVDRAALPPVDAGAARDAPGDAPVGALEEQIAEVWQRVLGVPRVGRRQSFFDVGGHSLLAARLVAELGELGHTLPLASLFEARTIEAQAAAIQAGTEGRWPTLFAVQPKGTRPPLFCVCRPNVNALGYIALARHLGDDQPVYGLQQQYRDESDFPYEVEEYQALAQEYLVEMKKVAPAGPYRLLGMCEGAHIAFEIVRLLEARGEAVELFAPLDAWPVENTRSRPLTWIGLRLKWAKERLGSSSRPSARNVVSALARDVRGLPVRVTQGLAAGRGTGAMTLSRTGRTEVEERFHRRYWPGPGFVPPTIRCAITVFRVRSQHFWRVRDEACGWGDRSTGGVRVVRIEGEHDTFLREPHVRDLARKLRESLPRS
jgi:amino acid adenylation domain-containing protein